MKKNKGKTPNIKCELCGKEFYAKPYFLKHGWGKYCSKKCKDASQRKGKKWIKLLKNLWGSWCNSSIRVCGALGTDANSADPQVPFLKLLRFKKKKTKSASLKRPSKKVLYELYWKKNYTQTEIAEIFNATHTSAKRWFNYYKIPVKPRALSCGRNLNSVKNLELGKTPEAERKSAETRRIYSKERLIEKIKKFVEKEGRVPTKNEFVNDPSCPDYVTYRDYFGTWNKAIKAAGYEPNERWFSSRDLYAKDGHQCKSISEIIIDDWLLKNNISHFKKTPYPAGRYRCDFVVNNIFIEFFGLVGALDIVPNYNEFIRKKRELCRKYNIPLTELYEKDLYNLDQTLGEKLGLKTKQKVLF